MSLLQDHGLEVIRKSGELVTPGDKSDCYLKVKDSEAITALNSISTGVESFNIAFVCGPVAVTNVPVIAKVGASNLADRKFLTIANYTGVGILYGPATVANASDNGIRIPNGADRTIEVGPNINIYIVRQSGAGSVNVVVHEGS